MKAMENISQKITELWKDTQTDLGCGKNFEKNRRIMVVK
jgi:hypothetical protein